MTHYDLFHGPDGAMSGLPDPHSAPAFYDGVVVKRGLAWLVDVVLITLFSFVAALLTIGVGFFFWPLLALVIGVFYRVATLSNRSATWGMRLFGIELRDHRGQRFDGMHAALHVAGYYASIMFMVLPALASAAAMLVTERKQGLTDLVLGSAAINSPD